MASTVWRGYITFGLISIPVRLFRAGRAERVSLRRMYRAPSPGTRSSEPELSADEPEPEPVPVRHKGPVAVAARRAESIAFPPLASPPASVTASPVLEPVRQVSARSESGEPVPERSVVKGYEYEKDRFVALEPDELKTIVPKTATEMEIQEFVRLPEVDPVYFETSYYVVPEEAGWKAYALLRKAMEGTHLVAVAQFAMHGREHVVIVRPGRRGLVAHTMFFESEVHADEEFRADGSIVSDGELNLAETLITSLAGPFQPEKYRDTYREKLEELIARKVAGQPVLAEQKPARSAAVVDITEALQRSLAALKKPPSSEANKAEVAEPAAAPRQARTTKKISRAGSRP